MNIIRENIDELNSVIKLNIEKSDYEKRVNDILKGYQKKANMPGFRPGKVPFGMIQRMYGVSVLVDEMNKIISENITEYIAQNNLRVLGEPLPSESQKTFDFDTDENFEFTFDIALAPEFEVNLDKKIKVPFYRVAITDDMVDGEMKNMTGRFGKNEQSEKIGEKSVVKGSFIQVDEAGNDVENGITTEDSVISMAVIKDDKAKKLLLNKAVGESVTFDVRKAFPNDNEMSYILKISKEEAEKIDSQFKLTISEITDFTDPELNQELFDKLFGKDVVTSEEEMIAKVKENLGKNSLMESEYRFTMDARKAISSKLDIKLPEDFLKRWIRATNKNQEEVSDENMEKELPRFIEDLRWQLIKDKIAKDKEVKIEQEDVIEYAKKAAKIQFMQYGLTSIPDEHIERYAVDMMKEEESAKRFYDGALSDKVMNIVKESVKLDEKEISREDFNKLFEE